METKKIRLLGISGSLRNSSSNTVIIKAIGDMLPDFVDYAIYEGIGSLPHFNDSNEITAPVIHWKECIAAADGIIICSPEYAFGVPGSLKNALDWTVSSGEFVNKKVALITAASVGDKAHAAMLHTLTAISCDLADNRNLLIQFVRSKLNNGEISNEGTKKAIEEILAAILAAVLE